MATQITNYQCPACTAPLQFSSETGKLECEYCGGAYEVADIEALYSEKNEDAEQAFVQEQQEQQQEDQWDTSDLSDDWGADREDMRAYSCPSCGAELICEETTAATSCPYCGNPSVIPGQFSGALKPDYVIPFKLSKEAAMDALNAFYKKKPFLPKGFASQNHVQEIKGIYVPFWLFDAKVDADVSFHATRSRRHRRGDEEIITTDHFRIHRAGAVSFEKIPVDASQKMPDGHMDAIEPYDYSQMVPFSKAYMPGYLADKFDVEAEASFSRADERAKNSAYEAMRASVTGIYETCVPEYKSLQLNRGKASYALLPVWLLNSKWNGKDYLFAVNGQTGKLVGNLPVSWGKFFGMLFAMAVPITVVLMLLLAI